MPKKDSFTKLTKDIVRELEELDSRCLKPSKKLRLLTSITKQATTRLNKLMELDSQPEL